MTTLLRGLRIWLVQDACGYVCAGMTWSLILYAFFVVFLLLYNADFGHAFDIINGLIFSFFALLAGGFCAILVQHGYLEWLRR